MPTDLGTLDAIHLAAALLWEERNSSAWQDCANLRRPCQENGDDFLSVDRPVPMRDEVGQGDCGDESRRAAPGSGQRPVRS